jgi:DNA polymerase-3 subunit delta'
MFGIQLLGYAQIKKILQYSIINNKVAHAYCFIGPDGVGKDAMALEFAKTMNCSAPVIENMSISPCNECKSCKMASTFEHPNIYYVFALPSKKSDSNNPVENMSEDQIKLVQEKLAEKVENPYSQMIIPGSNNIKINQIRDVKKKLSLSASSSGKRFVIISKAERMTEEAANAFLKTLEEPHEDTTIIITSSRKEALLQTILSRCQLIMFNPLPDEEVAYYLKENYNLDDITAKTIAAFALGSI